MDAGLDPARLFSPFDLQSRKTVAAAVSGGSDSTALLVLAQRWLSAAAPHVRLAAVTVDHRLRPESAAEAQTVARFCAERGVPHRTLAWANEKPSTGLSEAARLARYRLLADAARDFDTDIVLTGHTLDDQIETVRMRRMRGAGRGLAGMAAATLFDGRCWVLRPLLGTRRDELRAMLLAHGIRWADDPSNVDQRYERPRIRAARHEGDVDITAEIAGAQRERRRLGEAAAALVEAHADQPVPGLLRLRPAFLERPDRDAVVYALRILLAVAGGSAQLPDAARSADLVDALAASRGRATLSRCVADRRANGLYLRRERRDLPTLVLDGRETIWDGRFRIAGSAGTLVRPAEVRDLSASLRPDDVPESLAKAALATLPAFYRRDGSIVGAEECAVAADRLKMPQAGRPSSPPKRGRGAERSEAERGLDDEPEPAEYARSLITPLIAPWNLFLPDLDLAPATAVARLIGAPPLPPAPFTGHKDISA